MAAASAEAAPTLTDRVMVELLEKHLPAKVYEQGNNPWPGGQYKVEVFKAGVPVVTSGEKAIHARMPLRILITGTASSEWLRVKVSCRAEFTTTGEIDFMPQSSSGKGQLQLESAITLPVPPVKADCDGMQLAAESYLRAFVTQNRPQWEARVDEEVNAWLGGQ